MTNVVINHDPATTGVTTGVTVEVTADALARVSFALGDRDTVKQVRILTAAVISIVSAHSTPTPPAGNVEAFIVAQLAAMEKALAILNAV